MSYSGKTDWINGDIVESADMNRIETALGAQDSAITALNTQINGLSFYVDANKVLHITYDDGL